MDPISQGDQPADVEPLRDLQAGTQRPIPLADLVRELRRADASHRHGEAAQS